MACHILMYSNICSHILDIICAVYKKKLFGSVFEFFFISTKISNQTIYYINPYS